jgi:hypothetical protein
MLAGLLAGGAVGAGAVYLLKQGKDGIPGGPRLGEAAELAMVPGDAVGFVHFRARDVWHSPHFAEFRKVIEKAGPEAVAALDRNFVPAPSSLDRITIVLMDNPGAPKPPQVGFDGRPRKPLIDAPAKVEPVAVVAFSAPFDADKVRQALLPEAEAKKSTGGREYWAAPGRDLALYFPNDTVLAVGTAAGVGQFVGKQTGDGSPSPGALARAAAHAGRGGRHFAAAVNMRYFAVNPEVLKNDLEDLLDQQVPVSELLALTKDAEALLKAEAFGVGFALGQDESKFDVRAYFKDDAAAAEGEKAVRSVAAFARKKLEGPRTKLEQAIKGPPDMPRPLPLEMLPGSVGALAGLGFVNWLDGHLANPPLERDGAELVATFETTSAGGVYVGAAAVGVGLLLPAVQKVREAAGRMSASNNLKMIGLAMHNYHDANNRLPSPGESVPPNAKGGGLSWRVHILPYIEEDILYRQFKLDEPWDSDHNKKLIPQMPKVYVTPTAPAEPGKTYYKVFVGEQTMFPPKGRVVFPAVADGTSNTIMVVEGGGAVTWTKPDDVPFTGNVDPRSLTLNGNPRVQVLMGDGSVRTIDLSRIRPDTLRAAITRAGGEVLGSDW